LQALKGRGKIDVREPSSLASKWSWWERAIATGDAPIHERDPQVGYYRVRRWPRKPYWLAARVWIEPGEVDPETGELLSDERFCCEIDGERKNPIEKWTWLAGHPITLEEFQWLTAQRPLQPSRPPKSKSSR
jgi:hypothetical protein